MERTNKNKEGFNVLCLDPSSTAFGWSVVRGTEVIACGCIKTEPSNKKLRIRKGDDRCRRITEINLTLHEVIKKFKVAYIVSEQPHGSQSAVSATMMGIMLGIIQTISDFTNIGLEWYNEGDCKRCALGKSSATKKEMIDRMSTLYEVDWKGAAYKDEAIADSLAVHYVARKNSAIFKAMGIK